MQAEGEVRLLMQQHEQLTSKLEARHKQQMQVHATLAALQAAFGLWPVWLNRLTWPNYHHALTSLGIMVKFIISNPQDEGSYVTAYSGIEAFQPGRQMRLTGCAARSRSCGRSSRPWWTTPRSSRPAW